MTRLLLLFCALCSCAAPASALFGRTAESERLGLLWVPEEGGADWEALRELLESHDGLRLTVAVAPSAIPESAAPWLAELAAAGRVEPALRLEGDPILPLVLRNGGSDARERLAVARVRFRQVFGRNPAGFVPGDGQLSPETAAPLERLGFRWAAVGPAPLAAAPWRAERTTAIVPFYAPASTAAADQSSADGALAVVVRETSGVSALRAAIEGGRDDRWTTVAAVVERAGASEDAPDDWPGWSGPLSAWEAHPLQRRAWQLHRVTAETLGEYKDSGRAQLDTLRRAALSLQEAESSRFFRVENLRRPKAERAFRGHLARVFARIGRRVPPALRAPVYEGLAPSLADPDAAAPDAELPEAGGRVLSGRGEGFLYFENPPGSRAWASTPADLLPAGTTAEHLFTPTRLTVSWDESALTVTMGVRRLVNLSGAPNGFDTALLEVYADLNNLPGRGSTALLPGRRGFVPPQDAWEVAIVATGWGAGLYRALEGQAPALVAELKAAARLDKGEVSVTVPRRILRGNPSAWGFVYAIAATDAARARALPPEPLAAGDRPAVLGFLGAEEDQRAAEKPGAYLRLRALRLVDEQGRPVR